MAMEKEIWFGTPSQVVNIRVFIVMGLLSFFVIPLFVILWTWLVTKNTKYELTNERLTLRSGVFNKSSPEMELYRIRDYRLDEPYFLRLFSKSNVVLETSDRSHPRLVLEGVPNGKELINMLRHNVEACRMKKGVREIDVE
jgi:uncharacterized membrane protein YdbT with pleckstrin-like domain